MEFRDNEAIYLQIGGYVSQNILLGKWPAEHRLPSVRDLAIELQVNLNTVMRSYEHLQSLGVIYTRRGLGFFVTPDGYEKAKTYRKERFIQQDLSAFFNNVHLLDIDKEELLRWYEQFRLIHNESKSDKSDDNKQ